MNRRSRFCLVPLGLLSLLLPACSGIEVGSDYDPLAISEMASYRAYAWIVREAQATGPGINRFEANRIKRAIGEVLAERGFREDTADPDFLVDWSQVVERRLDVHTYHSYHPYWWNAWYWPLYYPNTYVEEYDQGVLTIDIVDGRSNELIWRGWGSSRIVYSQTPEKRQTHVRAVVSKVLERFPPR